MIKMRKMEKIILGFIIGCMLIISIIIGTTVKYINNSGGIRQIVIDMGKDIKDISTEIKKEK